MEKTNVKSSEIRKNGSQKIKGQPAPAHLATPTDLKPSEAQAVIQVVNVLVADTIALYIKTKNFHWHLSGSHFRDYHLLFDEQAEALFEGVDAMAERVRRIGGTTIRSIGQISRLQTVTDDDDEYVTPEEMIRRLLIDNRTMAENQRAAIDVCDHNRDAATSNLIQEFLDGTERRIWFLFEIAQDAHSESQ